MKNYRVEALDARGFSLLQKGTIVVASGNTLEDATRNGEQMLVGLTRQPPSYILCEPFDNATEEQPK